MTDAFFFCVTPSERQFSWESNMYADITIIFDIKIWHLSFISAANVAIEKILLSLESVYYDIINKRIETSVSVRKKSVFLILKKIN